MKKNVICIIIGLLFLSGCAHLDFTDFTDGKGGVTYYDPMPYLFVSINKDCVTTATVVVLPEKKKTVKFIPGYGSADLSVGLSNGMFTSVGQKTDTKIPETIGAITGLVGSIPKVKAEPCTPSGKLFPIENGVPAKDPIRTFSFD